MTASPMSRALAPIVFAALAAFAMLGCAAADDHAPPLVDDGGEETPHVTVTGGCGEETGCACNTPGQVIDCRAYRKSGDYVACSPGTRTCGTDGRWGECLGDQIAK